MNSEINKLELTLDILKQDIKRSEDLCIDLINIDKRLQLILITDLENLYNREKIIIEKLNELRTIHG